ncbi:hypothetical protein N9H39_08310, partial [Gammaproteobacteria bacterium]|nr:hypothetical protein [Gammaproteobacteria bacterium]
LDRSWPSPEDRSHSVKVRSGQKAAVQVIILNVRSILLSGHSGDSSELPLTTHSCRYRKHHEVEFRRTFRFIERRLWVRI